MNRPGKGDWLCDVAWPAAAYLPELCARLAGDLHVVHLVRHPLAMVRSRATPPWDIRSTAMLDIDTPTKYGRWIMGITPDVASWPTVVERTAAHWVLWNNLIAPWASERLRIEDVTPDTVNRLARIVDPDAPGVLSLQPRRNVKPDKMPPLTWAEVEHIDGLLDLAREYGYL